MALEIKVYFLDIFSYFFRMHILYALKIEKSSKAALQGRIRAGRGSLILGAILEVGRLGSAKNVELQNKSGAEAPLLFFDN